VSAGSSEILQAEQEKDKCEERNDENSRKKLRLKSFIQINILTQTLKKSPMLLRPSKKYSAFFGNKRQVSKEGKTQLLRKCKKQGDSKWDVLPVSAEPGLTHDIFVSRTSVRPKACNKVTGSDRKESPDSGGKPGRVTPGRTGLQESCRLPKRKRTRMAICTYNARTLASEAAIEDLMMQAKKIKYDVIGLTETRRRHPLNAVYETGEELFLGTCDSRVVGGVDVLVNTSMAKNIDSFEQLTTRIGRLRMRRCGPTPDLTIFVAYAPTSSYEEEEVEAFYMDLEKFYREDHAFYKVIIGDFNAKVGPRRTSEELREPRPTME
ncbi:hypothetical protein NECAME_09346, partial [Necator americanus]